MSVECPCSVRGVSAKHRLPPPERSPAWTPFSLSLSSEVRVALAASNCWAAPAVRVAPSPNRALSFQAGGSELLKRARKPVADRPTTRGAVALRLGACPTWALVTSALLPRSDTSAGVRECGTGGCAGPTTRRGRARASGARRAGGLSLGSARSACNSRTPKAERYSS